MKLIENFIFQNFEDICDQIRHGVNIKKRTYLNEWLDGITPTWNLTSYENSHKDFKFSERDVHNAINLFVFLCEHSDRLDKSGKFSRIGDTIRILLKISCGKNLTQISLEKYFYQIANTEQVTKFIFHAYSFKFNKKDEFFEDRIKMYNEVIPSELKQSSYLMKYMQRMRNKDAHNSYKWKTGRKECLDELIYLLYDYITIVYMLEYVVGRTEKMDYNETNQNKNKTIIIRGEQYKQQAINISLETPEDICTPTNNIQLYLSDSPQRPIHPQANGVYRVTRFDNYRVKINASELSSAFTISHEFTDGCTVLIGFPPKETKPIRPEVFDVFDKDDIPEDVQFLIELLDRKYSGTSDFKPYLEIVKSLINYVIIPSKDHEGNVHDYIKKIEEGLVTKLNKDCCLEDVSNYLQSEAQILRDKIVKPFKNNNFADLCKKIDKMYEKITTIRNTENQHNEQTNVDMLESSVSQFLNDGILNIDCSEQYGYQKAQQELLKIQTALDLYEYDSELAQNYIKETISNFYNTQNTIVNEADGKIIKIFNKVEDEFWDLVSKQGEKETYAHFLLMKLAVFGLNSKGRCLLFCNYTDFVKKLILKIFLAYMNEQQSLNLFLEQIEGMRNYKNIELKLIDFRDDFWFDSIVYNMELLKQHIKKDYIYSFKCAYIDILNAIMDINDRNERYNLIGILYSFLIHELISSFNSCLDDEAKVFVKQIKERIDGINDAYIKGDFSTNSDYMTVYAKRIVNRYCKIIKDRYQTEKIPEFVSYIMNYQGASLPIEYKALLLNKCVDKKIYNLYWKNKNLYEYMVATSLFNLIADNRNYINNGQSSFIDSFSKKYLLQVYREEIVNYYLSTSDDEESERWFRLNSIANLLDLAFNEVCLELAYRYNFDTNEQSRRFGYPKDLFYMSYVHNIHKTNIGTSYNDMVELILYHIRIQRLEKYAKSHKDFQTVVKGYNLTIHDMSDNFMHTYYPNGVPDNENNDKGDNYKLQIAKYIIENHLTTPPEEGKG